MNQSMSCKFCTETLKRLDENTLDFSAWMKEEGVTEIGELHELYNRKIKDREWPKTTKLCNVCDISRRNLYENRNQDPS